MKNKIKLFATQIPYDEEELEENVVYVEFDVKELLYQIDNDDIAQYARNWCGMLKEDECQYKLEDFEELKLVEELESRDYNFTVGVSDEDMIEHLEYGGYNVTRKDEEELSLDYIDQVKLNEIVHKYVNGSWAEREEMYKKLIR